MGGKGSSATAVVSGIAGKGSETDIPGTASTDGSLTVSVVVHFSLLMDAAKFADPPALGWAGLVVASAGAATRKTNNQMLH